ncbi:MAG: efflux RND transporter periplasmic adaptor subunit [Chitinophagales bacterium]|nr:efflux RND transporter periplasmic adaptor subunit [Chitinophagales bacterium]
MKRIIVAIVLLLIVGSFIYVGFYLYQKNQAPPEKAETTTPFKTTIVKKTVATGAINPRREVALKPQISGIVDKLYVQAGEYVTKGQTIAKIRVIPENLNLNAAESNVNKAKIALQQADIELKRREQLYKAKVISEVEYNQYKFDYDQRKEDLENAQNNLQLIREGVSNRQQKTTTIVTSTISGMVLDVPIKEGAQVIQSNSFNDGTTIATVADMNDLIFEGKLDESEVGKVKEGMNLRITVGAIEGKTFDAKLEYISPKGVVDQGTIQFTIKAAVKQPGEKNFIRAGYSANADIILESRDSVLAVLERDIQFSKDTAFVEVEKTAEQFEKRKVKLGLSDGINVEVLDGVAANDKIKVMK